MKLVTLFFALAMISGQASAFVIPTPPKSTAGLSMAKAADICPEVSLETGGNSEIALVALGWFWHPQPAFQAVDGVKRCLVGYTGGEEDEVTYQNIADYTEALLIEYDPTVVSYGDILKLWKEQASPYPCKRQYRTALWYVNESQKKVAEDFMSGMSGAKYVDIEPATQFFMAEEYHQNFLEKQTAMYRI